MSTSYTYENILPVKSRFGAEGGARLERYANYSDEQATVHHENQRLFQGQLEEIVHGEKDKGLITYWGSNRMLAYKYDAQKSKMPMTLEILDNDRQILATVQCEFQSLYPKKDIDEMLARYKLSPHSPHLATAYRISTTPWLTRCAVTQKDFNTVQNFFRQYGGEHLLAHLQFEVLS